MKPIVYQTEFKKPINRKSIRIKKIVGAMLHSAGWQMFGLKKTSMSSMCLQNCSVYPLYTGNVSAFRLQVFLEKIDRVSRHLRVDWRIQCPWILKVMKRNVLLVQLFSLILGSVMPIEQGVFCFYYRLVSNLIISLTSFSLSALLYSVVRAAFDDGVCGSASCI